MTNPTLADAISDLRSEISKAQKASAPGELKFHINEIELDLELVATAAVEIEGGVEAGGTIWSVLTAKANAGASRTSGDQKTHRVKLKMSLVPDKDGTPQKISGHGRAPSN